MQSIAKQQLLQVLGVILISNGSWFRYETLPCILLVNAVITVGSIVQGCTWEINGTVNDQAVGQGLTDWGSRSYSSKLAEWV